MCNALRNDLNHPNEYVRGCTLRFLCKLREPELLEPLIPTVKVRALWHKVTVHMQRRLLVFSCFALLADVLGGEGGAGGAGAGGAGAGCDACCWWIWEGVRPHATVNVSAVAFAQGW